jgi:uncharacterized protein
VTYYLLEYRYADADRRAVARPRHLDYIGRLHDEGKVVLAGPLADASGAVVVYRVADEAEARALVDADPYTTEGVSEGVTLREWTVLFPSPDHG